MKIEIDIIEPLVFLRKPPNWSSAASNDSNQCQLRGIITINSNKCLYGDKLEKVLVQINFTGHLTKVTQQKEFQFHNHEISLPISDESVDKGDGQQQERNNYSIPFSLSVSPDLPPTVDTELGRLNYYISAFIFQERGTSRKDVLANTKEVKDIYLVGDAASSSFREDGESDPYSHPQSIEDIWRDTFYWKWTFMTNHSSMGGMVPLRFSMARIGSERYPKAELRLIRISLVEQIESLASINSKCVQRSRDLLTIGSKKQASFPVSFDQKSHPKVLESVKRAINEDMVDVKRGCKDSFDVEKMAEEQVRNLNGPWVLAWDLRMPHCENTRCNSTVIHPLSPVSIKHFIEVKMYISTQTEEDMYEIKLSIPFVLRCIYLTDIFSQLPCFYCSCFLPHPYEAHEERNEAGLLTLIDDEPQSMIKKETEGKSTFLNSSFSTFFGKNDANLSGKTPELWLQDRKNIANKWIDLMSQAESPPPSYHALYTILDD